LKSTVLDKAYNDERDADVKERILLVIRVLTDKQHIELVAQELHKSRVWAYKWYKRYNGKGLDGLKDKSRSGRPPSLVNNDLMIKIRKELSDSNTGWDFRQVMDLIHKRAAAVKYHELHIYRLLHKWGFISKVPLKKFVRTATTPEEKKKFKKEYKRA
jgi:putative transposase